MCWYHILSTLNLHARPRKIQKYHFLSMGPPEHPKWRGAACSNTRTPKVPFSAKIPMVNPSLTKGQTRSKSTQNNMFHGFISNPSSSKGIPKPKKKKKTFLGLALCLDVFYTFFFSREKTHKKHIKTSWFFLLHQKYKVLFLFPIFFSLVLYLGFGV